MPDPILTPWDDPDMWRAFVAALCAGVTAFALENPVRTGAGLVSGSVGAVSSFKGIPYAAPPTGNLRWRPPQPAAHWDGVREATKFGAICMQAPSLLRDPSSPMSEDCLTLNLWTPANKAADRLPVMVWIHGGGFRRGSSSQPQYDGERLAQRGVVVVGMNYRLGVFGFLAHPALSKESPHGVSGNYGLLDQIAALEWVKHNIGTFGGDPSQVTIFGESAGAFSVLLLNVSPLAKALFRYAISESGGLMIPHLRESSRRDPAAERLGQDLIPDPITWRVRSATEVLEVSEKRQAGITDVFLGLVFRPVVDGWILPEDPVIAYRSGHTNSTALLAGTNADEGTAFTSAAPAKTVAQFHDYVARWGYAAPLDPKSDAEVRPAVARFIADVLFFWPTREALRGTASISRAAWQYEFTRVNGAGANGLGAFHGSEIPYVFGNLDVVPLGFGPVKPGTYTGVDFKLSETMQSYWVQFARTGDPNGPGLPRWERFRSDVESYLEIGSQLLRDRDLRRQELNALTEPNDH